MNKVSNWLWGCVLIALGVILGVNVLGVAHINIFFPGWWTLFIIVPCFIGLFKKNESKTADLIGILIGVCLMLGCLGVLQFDMIWKLILPVVLVICGLSLILKDTLKGKVIKEVKKLNRHERDEYWATFASQKLDFAKQEFKGCKLEAVFGGIRCDLRGAEIKEDTVISSSSIFGGVTIFVPDDVNVKIVSTNLFGGVEDKRREPTKDAKYTIYIESTCLFGGLEVR